MRVSVYAFYIFLVLLRFDRHKHQSFHRPTCSMKHIASQSGELMKRMQARFGVGVVYFDGHRLCKSIQVFCLPSLLNLFRFCIAVYTHENSRRQQRGFC
jgi:hypothetical protein